MQITIFLFSCILQASALLHNFFKGCCLSAWLIRSWDGVRIKSRWQFEVILIYRHIHEIIHVPYTFKFLLGGGQAAVLLVGLWFSLKVEVYSLVSREKRDSPDFIHRTCSFISNLSSPGSIQPGCHFRRTEVFKHTSLNSLSYQVSTY